MLGLSYRAVERFLRLLDCHGCKSTIGRDVAAVGQNAEKLHRQAPRMRVRVLRVDGTRTVIAGREGKMLFFAAPGPGRLIGMAPAGQEQTQQVCQHLAKVLAALRGEELETNEHFGI